MTYHPCDASSHATARRSSGPTPGRHQPGTSPFTWPAPGVWSAEHTVTHATQNRQSKMAWSRAPVPETASLPATVRPGMRSSPTWTASSGCACRGSAPPTWRCRQERARSVLSPRGDGPGTPECLRDGRRAGVLDRAPTPTEGGWRGRRRRRPGLHYPIVRTIPRGLDRTGPPRPALGHRTRVGQHHEPLNSRGRSARYAVPHRLLERGPGVLTGGLP